MIYDDQCDISYASTVYCTLYCEVKLAHSAFAKQHTCIWRVILIYLAVYSGLLLYYRCMCQPYV